MNIKKLVISAVVLLSLLISSNSVYSQKYLEEIAADACDCFSKITDTVDVDVDEISYQMGLCIFEVAGPYKKKLKKDYDINLNDINAAGEDLGVLVASQMMSECPDLLMYYSLLIADPEEYETEGEYESDEYEVFEAKGVITSVSTDNFVTLSLKEESGRTNKYYWMSYIDSEFDVIAEYPNLVGDMVIISYDFIELFDPRINEYRDFRLIYEIKLDNKIE